VSGPTTHLRKRVLYAMCATVLVASGVLVARNEMFGQSHEPGPTDRDPITVAADFSHEWRDRGQQVLVLRGNCRITQGDTILTARQMVVWRSRHGARDQVTVYSEDNVRVERPERTISESSLLMELVSRNGVDFEIRRRVAGDTAAPDALFERGQTRKQALNRNTLVQTQLAASYQDAPELRSAQIPQPTPNLRRIRIFPRTALPYDAITFESKLTTPPEQVVVLSGGINLLIDGVEQFGTIDLAADRMVIWTRMGTGPDFTSDLAQTRDTPFQVYLEGNIVVRQGQNVLRASRAFYDARDNRGQLLDAELRSFVPQLGGDVRVRAERVRQLSENTFHAQNGWVTASPFGAPGYRLQASDIFFEQREAPFSAPMEFDPETGMALPRQVPWVTSLNNVFLIEDFPLLYLPRLSGPAEDMQTPLRSVSGSYDRIFGAQARTVWNAFSLFGMETPDNVLWDLQGDFLSRRGPAVGTSGNYQGFDLFGIPSVYSGFGNAYYVYDQGTDILGLDRRGLEPRTNHRGRIMLRHRQRFPWNGDLIGEIGIVSDRNFLEQYFEREFDREKDHETLLYYKQQQENWAGTVLVRPQLNSFETQTEWLPKADVYGLSEPLLGGLLTWSSRSSLGYGNLEPARPPFDPADVFAPLPYVADVDGAVLMTRHELNLPLDAGPFRLVPYVMGEAAHWGSGMNGDSIDRLVGSAGVRSSVMFWRVFPHIHSRIFNLSGLAHKMVFDADFSWTDSSLDLDAIPQYHEIDDNAQERFRNRYIVNTFGGVLPTPFDPRFYAVRTGAGQSVAAPYHELVDDLQVLRLGWRHRLQTKVGPAHNMRIKDWMTLDLEAAYFPRPERDNFGEDFGLIGARYAWNVGDRTRFLADAHYDLFDDAQQLWSVAVLNQRSERGSVFVGVRQVNGAGLDSRILSASYSYVMSPKWISTFGTAYDIGENQNRGQSLTVTRVGADFLVHVGLSYDRSKDNVGAAISIEPRFGPINYSSTRLSSLLGIQQ
jgi:lipopolysaccharide export system protein LptA